ncbi:MAG TPA: FkbM family methyltransferase [Nitrospira sp.]|nr:FkbM family methyltransferase [Nitrospira sp.]
MRAMLKALVPNQIKPALRRMERDLTGWKDQWRLDHIRARAFKAKAGMLLPCGPYMIRINDGPNFFMQYKDIFVNRIYHFETGSPAPTILDCGGNIGMSVLYYKLIYPHAKVTTFEPDPSVFGYLQDNVARHGMNDVQLVQAAVCGREGSLTFHSDGKYASNLASETAPLEEGWSKQRVPCVRLSSYLTAPIEFLKINIEGAEWEALADSGERLRLVNEMVIEYHHLPGLPRTLHHILDLLDRQGFEYLINDFDSETNGGVQPPFRLTRETRYFLLVYAKRIDAPPQEGVR